MKHSYSGVVIFFRANKQGTGFGFIYSVELNKTFHFNERALASSDYQKPHVGDSVSFDEGVSQVEGKGPTAGAVRGSQMLNATEAVISLTAVAEVYRLSSAQLSGLLGNQQQSDGVIEFITVQQLLGISELVAQSKASKQADDKPVIRRVGKVVRYKEESGYGFIEQDGFDDVFVHVNSATPGVLTSGAWVVFTQDTNPKDPNKLRATNVKALATETSYLRANLGTFTDAILLVLLENAEESLRAPILNHWLERIDYESTFEEAQQAIELVEKYLPQDVMRYQNIIGKRLTGGHSWYWWQQYGAAEHVLEEALYYYNESATELIGDAENGFDLQGTLLLKQLPFTHFVGFFKTRWSYARVLESVKTEDGQKLLQDCQHVPDFNGIVYWLTVPSSAYTKATQKALWLVRYLASLDIAGLAELMLKALNIILPIPAFVAALPGDTETEYLMPLLAYDIPEVNAVVAPQLFERLETVETEAAMAPLVKLLKLCRKASDEALVALANELALRKCSKYFKVKLWALGLIPTVDVYGLLEALSSSEIRVYLQDECVSVRLPAATTLLLRAAEAGDDVSIRQGVSILRESRQQLAEEGFEQLVKIYPYATILYTEVTYWLNGQEPPSYLKSQSVLWLGAIRPAYSGLLTWLLMLHEEDATELTAVISHLTAAERTELFQLVVSTDKARLLGFDSTFLVLWVNLLEDSARLDIQQSLIQSRRNDLLLDLWIGGHSEYFDFARYYLLVSTLKKELQFQFLRKVFGLMASGSVNLTVEDLDSIPRHSLNDDNPLNRRLDYSIDLVLKVLMALRKEGKYPDGTSIIDCIISYSGNSTRQLLQFSTLFEPCPGRTIIKFSQPIDHRFALVGNRRYPASEDGKTVFGGSETFKVLSSEDSASGLVEHFILYNGKRYRIKWETEREWPYNLAVIPSDGKVNITCCEGHKAIADDRTTKSSFWWCFGQACHKANQKDHAPGGWQEYVLRDFIKIAGLPFHEEPYYRSLGLINRVNQLVRHMYCDGCGIMMHPYKTSAFNFYRDTEFRCVQGECKEHGKIVYLNRCLNSNCPSVIDSRISRKCDYEDLGHGGWNGLYICDKCGGCCSRSQLVKKIYNLEKIFFLQFLNV